MRRRVVLTSVVSCAMAFGLGLGASASAQSKEKEQAKPPAAAGAKEHTMTGCLQKGSEAGTWVLQNTAGKGPKTVGIVESKEKLEAHVGHKIDITGTEVTDKEVAAMKTKPAKADHYMKVTAVKMVSQTCP